MAEVARSGTKSGTVRQRAIEALLTNRSQTAAAEAASVPLRTLARWLTDPEFVAELRAAEAQALDETGRRLLTLAGSALDALGDILAGEDVPATLKRQTAVDVLDRLMRWREGNIEERLAAIEEKLNP